MHVGQRFIAIRHRLGDSGQLVLHPAMGFNLAIHIIEGLMEC